MVMAVNSKRTNSLLQLLAGTAIMISAVILAGYFFFRIDMTSEKRYTLSPSSKSTSWIQTAQKFCQRNAG